jgi:GNAT superfamily N-acetyltransferase
MQAASIARSSSKGDFFTARLAEDETIWRLAEDAEIRVWNDIVRSMPRPFSEAIGLRIEHIGTTTVISTQRADAAEFNRAFGTGVHAPVSNEELKAVISRFAGTTLKSPRFQLYPRTVESDMPERLLALGLRPSGRSWAKFVRGDEPVSQTETVFTVAEVTETEPDVYARSVVKGFGMPEPFADGLTALAGMPGWRVYVAREKEQVVGGAALYLGEGWSWFGIGAVLPAARGRGAQRALIERRIEDSRAAGCRIMLTETGKPLAGEPAPSYTNIGRSGFAVLYERPNYVFPEDDRQGSDR